MKTIISETSKELENQAKLRDILAKEINALHHDFHSSSEEKITEITRKIRASSLSVNIQSELLTEVRNRFPGNNTDYVPLSELQKLFGDKFYSLEKVCKRLSLPVPAILGIDADYNFIETAAKAGMYLVYAPQITFGDIVKKTAGENQKDNVVKYYPDQYDNKGTATEPWYKNVNKINYCDYIANIATAEQGFILTTVEAIDQSWSKVVSDQLSVQKDFAIKTFGEKLPANIKFVCDNFSQDNFKKMESADYRITSGMIISDVFIQNFWLNLAEDTLVYSLISENEVIRRGMYNRLSSASPDGRLLMFGGSEDGACVYSCEADFNFGIVGVPFSCRLQVKM